MQLRGSQLERGLVIGGYRIDELISRGGMGVVYRATNIGLNRIYALKVLAPELADDAAFRERFKREMRIAASISHPNVVGIHYAGEQEGLVFFVMDFIHGTDLREVIQKQGPLEAHRAVDLLTQFASALDAAHARGLVHRDVKPANILITVRDGEEHAYLTDFGVAKRSDTAADLTARGAVVGTVDYMAPEQITGGHTDARTDIYALGCVFFQMLTGNVPYDRENSIAKLFAHVHEAAPPLAGDLAALYPKFGHVLETAMAKEPSDRYLSAGDFARDAAAALKGAEYTGPATIVATGDAKPTDDSEAGGGELPDFELPAPLDPTRVPSADAPSVQPEATVPPAPEPTVPPQPTPAPEPTVPPQATPGPESTRAPEPPPEPAWSPEPTPEVTRAPEPTPEPAWSPEPTPEVTRAPGPAPVPDPTPTPEPSYAPAASAAAAGAAAAGAATAGAAAGSAATGSAATPASGVGGTPPPTGLGGPPTPDDSGSGSRRSPLVWIGAVALLVAAVVVVVIVVSGGGSSSKPGFAAKAEPVPTNRVTGNGSATVALKGDQATVTLDTAGLLNGSPHAMHIHAGGQGICPPASAAREHNGHLSISTTNGIKFYGPPQVALTSHGDSSPKSIVDFSRYPTTGNIAYERTVTVPPGIAAAIRAGNAVIVVHGIDYNHNGIYDDVLDKSELNASLPGEATAPALCGTLTSQGATASTGVGANGRIYTASLHRFDAAALPTDWHSFVLLCHLEGIPVPTGEEARALAGSGGAGSTA